MGLYSNLGPIDPQVSNGAAAHAILEEFAREIDSRSSGVLRFHVASLYPMLYRLERRGWISGRWVEKTGQRRRRYYRLTPEGRRMLAAQRTEWRGLLDALNRAAGLESA